MKPRVMRVWLLGLVVGLWGAATAGADWPTYRGDNRRSGVTRENLRLPLAEAWKHRPTHAPCPAWNEAPFAQDLNRDIFWLAPTTTYDYAFHVTAAGGAVYYGSSADDTVYCLDAARGDIRWSFVTEGPVRLAPAVAAGKLYVGSDDGCLYCLDARDGKLLWKHRGGAGDCRLPGNGRMISRWPIRCGIVVEDGVVYFTAGLFPTQDAFLYALDAPTGKELWKRKIDVSPQGYLLASSTRLLVPTGRTPHQVYLRADGKDVGSLPLKLGGCFAVVLNDWILHSAGEQSGIRFTRPETGRSVLLPNGLRAVVAGQMAYVLTKDRLESLNYVRFLELCGVQAKKGNEKVDADRQRITFLERSRKKDCVKWSVPCPDCQELLLAGQTVFVGSQDRVTAYRADDGEQLWTDGVMGKAYGLAVSDGSLLVSTDRGVIYCFRPAAPATSQPYPEVSRFRALEVTETVEKPSPYPVDARSPLFAQAAEMALRQAGVKSGYCLVLGVGTGRLAYEIARRSRMQILGLEPDADQVAAARKHLATAGIYGTRVSIHQGNLDKLPYQKHFANLIVSEDTLSTGRLPPCAEEVFRVLRPCGGTVVLLTQGRAGAEQLSSWGRQAIPNWKVEPVPEGLVGFASRGALPGEGRWTHLYAEPGNTACSGDGLASDPVELQWFGPPGPRRMVDRQHGNGAPLYAHGRLFVSGDNYIVGLDAYNGTILWDRNVPDSVRLGSLKNPNGMVATDDTLYVASGGDCLALDTQTGRQKRVLSVPMGPDGRESEWGYLAVVGDHLFGSVCKRGAAFRSQNFATHQLVDRDLMPVVCSAALFARNRHTGEDLWNYQPQAGVIINPTLAIGGGRVYLVESTNPETREVTDGRIKLAMLLGKGADLVALDSSTGKVLWRRPARLQSLQHIIFLSYAEGIVVITGSKNIPVDDAPVYDYLSSSYRRERLRYDLAAFDAATGKPLWQTTQVPLPDNRLQGGHGEQKQHPAIVNGVIYGSGFACRLATGQPIDGWVWKKSGNCGTLSTSLHCGFSRSGGARMSDLKTGEETTLTKVVRPGCWINIIPAGGLILMPEASAGCSCGYSIQTSLALTPCSR